jgi:hypothetical protein
MHITTVKENLSGGRGIDGETLCSVSVLAERLERVKQMSPLFAGVGFSEHMEELVGCEAMSVLD